MMGEYIEREALIENLRELHKAEIQIYNWAKSDTERRERISGCVSVAECIVQAKEAPTADVVEVRHGEWCLIKYEYFVCSRCGHWHYTGCESKAEAKERLLNGAVPNYCSNCGAKMDGKGEK